jgi:uncharacterized protein YndB with AHSA1/START domain
MVEVKGEIVIDRRPEEVFDFVSDEENEPLYNPQMWIAKKTTDGPIGVGTTFAAKMTGRRGVVPMTIQFTEYDRPHRLAEQVQMKSMDLTGELTFDPVDSGTLMRWAWNVEPHGVARFMAPVVAIMGRRSEHRIWTSLKRLLESRTVYQLPVVTSEQR